MRGFALRSGFLPSFGFSSARRAPATEGKRPCPGDFSALSSVAGRFVLVFPGLGRVGSLGDEDPSPSLSWRPLRAHSVPCATVHALKCLLIASYRDRRAKGGRLGSRVALLLGPSQQSAQVSPQPQRAYSQPARVEFLCHAKYFDINCLLPPPVQ